MKELSIFVDESGDMGLRDRHSRYYVISMVLHDQSADISAELDILDRKLRDLGCAEQPVHTEPLIRREFPYHHFAPNERRAILTRLFYFALSVDIKYKTFIFFKNEFDNVLKMQARMSKEISQFLRSNLSFFQSFDKVILYYDNGQQELNRILNSVLAAELAEYDVRKALPVNYRLSQVADLICTLELLNIKIESGQLLSRSEELIFHSPRDFKKDFLRGIRKKSFD